LLDTLITSKTRVKLLLKFFLNANNSAYLRGLEQDFNESSNGIRLELNRLEEAGMLNSTLEGNKKLFKVNVSHPLYNEINSLVRKYLGLDVLVEKVVEQLGDLEVVYLTGKIANGLHSNLIELFVVGKPDRSSLHKLTQKAEKLLNKKVTFVVYEPTEAWKDELKEQPNVLLWAK
jgi:hypothetical protein